MRAPYECTVPYHRRGCWASCREWLYTTVAISERLVDAKFAPLFGTLQEAIGRARKLVSLGVTGVELQALLIECRQLLARTEQYAQLAPEDERDSLLDLCDGAHRSLSKLERAVPRDSGRSLTAPESSRRAV